MRTRRRGARGSAQREKSADCLEEEDSKRKRGELTDVRVVVFDGGEEVGGQNVGRDTAIPHVQLLGPRAIVENNRQLERDYYAGDGSCLTSSVALIPRILRRWKLLSTFSVLGVRPLMRKTRNLEMTRILDSYLSALWEISP